MSLFWECTLLFFIISGFLMSFVLLSKKRAYFIKNKLLLLFLFLFTYNTVLSFYSWSQSDDKLYNLLLCALLIPLLLYGVIIYLLIMHPRIISEQNQHNITQNQKYFKYEKTGLSETFSLELKNKLEHLMGTEKLYLQHELRLDDIAKLLNISRHHASQVINENFNMSFYDYINAYRIEEAKNKLSSFGNSVQSISEIAYQCGFNNRVSFYKAFKKITHITPKEFIQKAA